MLKRGVCFIFAVLLCIGLLVGCDDTVPVVAPADDTTDTPPVTDAPVTEPPETETDPVTEPETDPVTEPVTEPETEPVTEPETEPPVIRLEVPSPIGKNINDLGEIPFPEEQILFVSGNYCLPIGTVYDVTFVGEQDGDTLYIAPESLLVLHVSEGIDPFMTLSFMALPVIPTLRITTRGVIDVITQQYI